MVLEALIAAALAGSLASKYSFDIGTSIQTFLHQLSSLN